MRARSNLLHLTAHQRSKLSFYMRSTFEVEHVERKEGWYGRLSANGYLDCTEWEGPHATEQEALDAVKEAFDVDDEGELIEDQIDEVIDYVESHERGDATAVEWAPGHGPKGDDK